MPAFAALRVPAFRRLIVALTVMEVGLYAFETALFWTVLEETGSAIHVSLLFVGLVMPVLVLTVPIGVLVDRTGPWAILVWSSVAAAVVVAIAALAAATTGVPFELALLLAIAEGIFFGCFAVPAQVVIGRVVPRSLIGSAIGLSAIPGGAGSIVGGVLGGLLLEVAGPAATFVVAATGLAAGIPFIVGLPRLPGLEQGTGMPGPELRMAVAWLRGSRVPLAIVLLGAVAGLFIMSRFSLLPVVVRDVLGGGPVALGLLTTAAGIGTLAGSVLTDALGRRFRRGRMVLAAIAVAALALAGLGLAPVLGVAVVLAGMISASVVVYQMSSATLLQLLAHPRMRGRVLAMFDVVRLGLVPVGSLVAGAVVDAVGVAVVLAAYGGLTLAAVALTAVTFRDLRRVEPEAGDTGTDEPPEAAGDEPPEAGTDLAAEAGTDEPAPAAPDGPAAPGTDAPADEDYPSST